MITWGKVKEFILVCTVLADQKDHFVINTVWN